MQVHALQQQRARRLHAGGGLAENPTPSDSSLSMCFRGLGANGWWESGFSTLDFQAIGAWGRSGPGHASPPEESD